MAGARAGPMDPIADAGVRLARLDDQATAASMHCPHVEEACDTRSAIGREGCQARPYVTRDGIERLERDDVADLGADCADLPRQPDRARRPSQGERDDAEQDSARAA